MSQLRDGVMKRGRTWTYVIRVTNPETGLSKPKWVSGFASEEEAKAARDEARVAARRGNFVDRSRVTVAAYLSQWLEGHAVEVKPKTHEDYRRIIDDYVVPHIGRLALQSVRPATLSALYAKLAKEGGKGGRPLSPRTVAYVHAVVRKALNDAVLTEQILTTNPALRAKRPRATTAAIRTDEHVWDGTQLRAFLAAAGGERWHALLHLAAYTGARRGELLFLRWQDVDLVSARPQIVIRGSVSVVAGKRIEGTTKTGRSRVVSIDPGTAEVLRSWRARQNEEREFAGASWRGDDHVFLTALGSLVSADAPGEVMRRVVKAHNVKAGDQPLPVIRFHDLRHTHATLLLLAGVPVHVVAARLGHVDPAITLRVYAHVLATPAAEAAAIFARAVSAGVSTTVGADDER